MTETLTRPTTEQAPDEDIDQDIPVDELDLFQDHDEREDGGDEADLDIPVPERSEDRADRREAREPLSRSEQLRATVMQISSDTIGLFQRSIAEVSNIASSPKNKYLELRRNGAQNKYNRKAAKEGTSVFKAINRHHAKAAAKARAKLAKRETQFGQHTAKMDERVNRAERESTAREHAIEQFKARCVEKKVQAQERKLIRQERRNRRNQLQSEQGLSRVEVQRRIDTFTDEDRRRIRLMAIAAARA